MLGLIKQELQRTASKVSMVKATRLVDIKNDLKELKKFEILNGFQHHILDHLYVLDLPDISFPIYSVIIVASPTYSSRQITFHRDGKAYPFISTAGLIERQNLPDEIENRLNQILYSSGYSVKYEAMLPRKRLAVRGGLAKYGRNNITYIDGFGSFFQLSLFFSNIPCVEENWVEVCQMELCDKCEICLKNCPTGAIREDRFLIDNEKCLTYMNESAQPAVFPEWISKGAHNSVFECLRCQISCPENLPYLSKMAPEYAFDEDETLRLLGVKESGEISIKLRSKLSDLGWENNLAALARNLNALFAQFMK